MNFSSILVRVSTRAAALPKQSLLFQRGNPRATPAPTLLDFLTPPPTRCLSQTCAKRSQDPRDLESRLRSAKPLVSPSLTRRLDTPARVGRNSRYVILATVGGAIAFYLYNSQVVPVTGRRRFNFLPDWFVEWHAGDKHKIIRQLQAQGARILGDADPRTRAVKRVMGKLIPVSGLAHMEWEIYVIADDGTANAFVLPGGKVFVHSGILNVCRTPDALAAVLGHEIAHSTASHAAERLSGAWVGNMTFGSLFFLAGTYQGLALFALWNMMGGYYLQELLYYLPMGRKQESEADYVGLMMMAEACYDPRQAVGFWERMEMMQRRGGPEVPEILSTHPSNVHRIEKIKEWMPEAMEKWKESDCRGTTAYANRFREAIRRGQYIMIQDS